MRADLLPSPPLTLATGAALLIDFDGTLVEIAERPDAVEVDAALQRLLEALCARYPERLAIVSGRSIAQLDHYLGPIAGRLAVIGSHGVERRWPGQAILRPEAPPELHSIESEMRAYAAERPGVLVEPKSLGVALHYRGAAERHDETRAFAESLADRHRLGLQHGKMMSEVKSGAGDKGTGLRDYMTAPQRAGLRPVFIGDDLTDEPAFAAAAALGGAGIIVGSRDGTSARYALESVGATRRWLEAAARAAE